MGGAQPRARPNSGQDHQRYVGYGTGYAEERLRAPSQNMAEAYQPEGAPVKAERGGWDQCSSARFIASPKRRLASKKSPYLRWPAEIWAQASNSRSRSWLWLLP